MKSRLAFALHLGALIALLQGCENVSVKDTKPVSVYLYWAGELSIENGRGFKDVEEFYDFFSREHAGRDIDLKIDKGSKASDPDVVRAVGFLKARNINISSLKNATSAPDE